MKNELEEIEATLYAMQDNLSVVALHSRKYRELLETEIDNIDEIMELIRRINEGE
jgi:archaellum component FlaC